MLSKASGITLASVMGYNLVGAILVGGVVLGDCSGLFSFKLYFLVFNFFEVQLVQLKWKLISE